MQRQEQQTTKIKQLTTTRCAYISKSQEVVVDTLPLSQLLPSDNFDESSQLVLKPSEILIKVRAVALSSVDTEICANTWQLHNITSDDDDDNHHHNPVVTGYEFSGVVVAVGSAVARMNELQAAAAAAADNAAVLSSGTNSRGAPIFSEELPTVRKGQAVVGLAPMNQRMGCMSEYTIQCVSSVVPKPALVLHEDAASVIGPGLRAMTALHYHATARPGDVILIVQGASPTGRLAIQVRFYS
jgi:NADPH:quinone reductase-like Zn-dependent oxidoreductase